MSEYKCCASIDGICHNVYGYGVKCKGYSEECKLRPTYIAIQKAAKNASLRMARAFGIKGDCE